MGTGEELRKRETNAVTDAVAQLRSRHDRALLLALGGVTQVPRDK